MRAGARKREDRSRERPEAGSRPRVAVLDHPRSFYPFDLFQAVRAQFELVWVLSEAVSDRNHLRLLHRLGTVVDISGKSLDEAADAIARHSVEGIVTFVDDLLVTTAELAQRLGLAGHRPDVAAALTVKPLQRAALARAGVAGPRFWSLAGDPAASEIDELIAEARFPVIVKEATGSGSRNMHQAGSAEDLRALLTPDGVKRIVEEYLHDDPGLDPRFGGYVSVESSVRGGEAVHMAIVGRTPLAEPLRETGVFAPAVLAEDVRAAVLRAADDAVRTLGVEHGMLHTEIKLTPDGPVIVEINGRLGGTPPYVIREATDDAINLFLEACRLAIGRSPEINEPLRFERVAYWLVLQPPVWATHVTRLDNARELAGLDGVTTVVVNRQVGDEVDWREGTLGHVMTVRGVADDHDALGATLAAIHDTAQIEYAGPAVASG